MNKSKIEWCDMTWNPVTGCYHNCSYCYARRIAERFDGHMVTIGTTSLHDFKEPYRNEFGKIMPYPCGFQPTFHRYRLEEPKVKTKGVKIFVCSMADLFGEWVPKEWISEIMNKCCYVNQHKYLFLTKNPKRYKELGNIICTDSHCWYGTTITSDEDHTKVWDLLDLPHHVNTFLSIEPLLEPVDLDRYDFLCKAWRKGLTIGKYIDWIIVGAQTGPKAIKPKPEWVQSIIDQARAAGIPIFLKNNLNWPEKIQEFPKEME